MINIDLSKSSGRLPRVIQRNVAVVRSFEELLDAYSSWLFFERHFLHVGRFGVAKALGMIDAVVTDNAGAAFHLPSGRELPDYAGPASRAALVLVAAGLEVDRLTRLASEIR
jgi:hypothetical protein